MHPFIKELLKYSVISRIVTIPLRARALVPSVRRLGFGLAWLIRGREWSDNSYDLEPDGVRSLAAAIGLAAGVPPHSVRVHAKELLTDDAFASRYRHRVTETRLRYTCEPRLYFGKCLMYYMLVRAIRPRLVVEAGTLNGLGSLAICRALTRNSAEGAPGRLVTIDIAKDRGEFLDGSEGGLVTRLTGDSASALEEIDSEIDCFIHDTINEAGHMRAEFSALEPKLASNAVVFTVWFVEEFVRFCERTGLVYFEVVDRPRNHWHPGGRCGIASRRLTNHLIGLSHQREHRHPTATAPGVTATLVQEP